MLLLTLCLESTLVLYSSIDTAWGDGALMKKRKSFYTLFGTFGSKTRSTAVVDMIFISVLSIFSHPNPNHNSDINKK